MLSSSFPHQENRHASHSPYQNAFLFSGEREGTGRRNGKKAILNQDGFRNMATAPRLFRDTADSAKMPRNRQSNG